MDYKNFDVNDLWDVIAKGDTQAMQELINRFNGLILSEAKVYGRVNEDIAQDVRLAFFRAIKRQIEIEKEKENHLSK